MTSKRWTRSLFPAIEHTAELDVAATKAVLHNFIKVLEGGPTKHDAAIDNDAIPLLIDEGTDAEDALDMKMYKNQERSTVSGPTLPALTEVLGLLRI